MFAIENEHSHLITNAKAETPTETVTTLLNAMQQRRMTNGKVVLRDKEYGFTYPDNYPLQDIKRTVMVTPPDYSSPIINTLNEMHRYLANAFGTEELLLNTTLSPIKADRLIEYTKNSINHRSYNRIRARGITPSELAIVFQSLPTAVNEIVLEQILLGPHEITQLATMIRASPSLTKLTLDGCGLGTKGAEVVEAATHSKLTQLTITNDSVDRGVAAIATNSNVLLTLDQNPAVYHFRPTQSDSMFHRRMPSHPRRLRQTSTRSNK